MRKRINRKEALQVLDEVVLQMQELYRQIVSDYASLKVMLVTRERMTLLPRFSPKHLEEL